MDQQRRRHVAQPPPDLGGGQGEEFAIRGQQRATTEAGDERRGFGE
jgi:hypothetical protein